MNVSLSFDGLGRRILDVRDGKGIEHRILGPGADRTRVFERFMSLRDTESAGTTTLTSPGGVATYVRFDEKGFVHRQCGNGSNELLQYDDEGRLEGRVVWKRASDGAMRTWSVRYAYSLEGDLLRVVDSARGTTVYETDGAHRLARETTPSGQQLFYTLDAADNVISKPGLGHAELTSGNRIAYTDTEVFEYNHRDHIGVRKSRADGKSVRYQYDSFDMLIAIETVSANGTVEPTWQYAYDALGRRTEVRCGGYKRQFFWDADRLAAEIQPNGALRIYQYAGPGALSPLSFTDYANADAAPESGKTFYVFSDPVGQPLHIEDGKGEIVWWSVRNDPYGLIDIHPTAQLEYNLRWPGHYFDPETGLHYNRYRYYDPSLGRYLQSDPIGYKGSPVNLYGYCANPLVDVDVLGLTHPNRPGHANHEDGPQPHPGHEDTPAPHPHADGETGPPGPPRTAEARAECAHVINTMADMRMGDKQRSVVSVFTHADGTVSVGISGANSEKNAIAARQIETRLNRGSESPRYRVATEGLTVGVTQQSTGNAPGHCAEPHAAQAAHGHDSPITGTDTQWRGQGDNRYPFTGNNADGTPPLPNQMNPCQTCAHPDNAAAYLEHANG